MNNKKEKKPSRKMYFTKEIDDAILEYCSTTDQTKRNIIYNTKIKRAFEKLVENVINNWKSPYVSERFKDKKAEIISHLILNLDKFDASKGKAFSYFTYVAKNYIIINNNDNYKKIKQEIRIDIDEDDSDENQYQLFQVPDDSYDLEEIRNDKRDFIKLLIQFFEKNIHKIFRKNDIPVAYAVLQLMENYEDIENFNKKNIYILIREMTGKTKTITKVLNKMKVIYLDLYKQYYDKGTINFNYNIPAKSKIFFKY